MPKFQLPSTLSSLWYHTNQRGRARTQHRKSSFSPYLLKINDTLPFSKMPTQIDAAVAAVRSEISRVEDSNNVDIATAGAAATDEELRPSSSSSSPLFRDEVRDQEMQHRDRVLRGPTPAVDDAAARKRPPVGREGGGGGHARRGTRSIVGGGGRRARRPAARRDRRRWTSRIANSSLRNNNDASSSPAAVGRSRRGSCVWAKDARAASRRSGPRLSDAWRWPWRTRAASSCCRRPGGREREEWRGRRRRCGTMPTTGTNVRGRRTTTTATTRPVQRGGGRMRRRIDRRCRYRRRKRSFPRWWRRRRRGRSSQAVRPIAHARGPWLWSEITSSIIRGGGGDIPSS